MSVPSIKMPQSKLDKLAEDLQRLEVNTVVKVGPAQSAVPAFQRQGYLEKLGHARSKWFKRFFVLRDSMLLSYNLAKSDFTVEPRAAIHLGGSTIQFVEHTGRDFCFMISTAQKDRFLFAAESDEERKAWIKDLEEAKTITHANMIKLAVENSCLAEEKGASQITRDNTASALAIFSNTEYIQSTPITGGAEGWLRTSGFNSEDLTGGAKSSFLGKAKASLNKCYFILRDSHLMMFHGGDVLTKPRGVMYLLGTVTESIDGDQEGCYHFIVRSLQCGDQIGLVASSSKVRNRWIQALRIGSRVSYPDFKVLLKEHELLSALTMTPRAAPPIMPNKPAAKLEAPPVPMFHEVIDVQGEQLDPGTQQPYDAEGNPLLRNPDGKLVKANTGEVVSSSEARFGAGGEQLDPFNRPLPPGAVPMFTKEGVPIGVGPDGQHYLPDGTEVGSADAHFGADGAQLDAGTVAAADAIAANVSVAIKVRAKLKGDEHEAVDVLGRTFRESQAAKGKMVNADGEEVPLASARRVEQSGKLVEYTEQKSADSEKGVLKILVDNEGDEQMLGEVEINGTHTLRDVRELIKSDLTPTFGDFTFLLNGVPLIKYEEADKKALACLPEVTIRGKELKPVEPAKQFNRKLAEYHESQKQKEAQQTEFEDILARVRKGQFLRSVKDHMLED